MITYNPGCSQVLENESVWQMKAIPMVLELMAVVAANLTLIWEPFIFHQKYFSLTSTNEGHTTLERFPDIKFNSHPIKIPLEIIRDTFKSQESSHFQCQRLDHRSKAYW
jgi:hypothetical protein